MQNDKNKTLKKYFFEKTSKLKFWGRMEEQIKVCEK